ncbi:hypothetical protein A6V39_05115 [Candidatus Mycoplasma haematobovis]|uniref:Transmembrane protein 242 n=1 Tax=Candidatus Mycoplasma haematobovis TaxID=432608 RepID=A0A1A9QC34_9MOLU|nr:hypothetical protein [Candidatus Mycoplasma haematobovis]OAL09808.1 hypothetical protein A6V39_05115 [Candidatus Mycoplasma haematobovis]
MATPFALKASMVAGGIATLSGLGSVAYLSTWITIGDKLQKDKLTLISEDEDYKIVLFNNKESSDLKTAIS